MTFVFVDGKKQIILPIFIIVVEEMLKYSNKERINISSLGTSEVAPSMNSYSALNPKNLPSRPPNIFIPKNVGK